MINPLIMHHEIKYIMEQFVAFMLKKYKGKYNVAKDKTLFTKRLPQYGHLAKEYARRIILGNNSPHT